MLEKTIAVVIWDGVNEKTLRLNADARVCDLVRELYRSVPGPFRKDDKAIASLDCLIPSLGIYDFTRVTVSTDPPSYLVPKDQGPVINSPANLNRRVLDFMDPIRQLLIPHPDYERPVLHKLNKLTGEWEENV